MADLSATVLPPSDSDSIPRNYSSEFDTLEIPPLDSLFPSNYNCSSGVNLPTESLISDLGFGLGLEENGDFELDLDDLDDLYLTLESEDFLLPEGPDQSSGSVEPPTSPTDRHIQMNTEVDNALNSHVSGDIVTKASYSPLLESGTSGCSGNQCTEVANFAKSSSSDSENFNQNISSTNSPDYNFNASRVLNVPSPEHEFEHEHSGAPASSQGSDSGNFDSHFSEAMNKPSPGSDDNDVTVDQKVKVEDNSKPVVPKRRNEQDEENLESRYTKYRKSSTLMDDVRSPFESGSANEEEEKRKARLMRNRESAQLSRQRKKHYVEELEDKVRLMNSTITDLNSRISYMMAENAGLRQQLSSSGGVFQPPPPGMYQSPPPPPPGMYPHPPGPPMPYPWMPYPPYVVKQQGSQVPLVPIPKLKPQQSEPAKTKKNEVKKVQPKTKKVASISLLGLLSFTLLFGLLLPNMNVQLKKTEYHGPSESSNPHSDRTYDGHKGRALLEYGLGNGSEGDMGASRGKKLDVSERVPCQIDCMKENKESVQVSSGSEDFMPCENSSEPLVASLYVPRNNKLVKIDGNLIIHSVLASEKAMVSHIALEMKKKRETTLAIVDGMTPALAIPDVGGNTRRRQNIYRSSMEGQKALTAGSADTLKDHMKSTAADGKLQQWFREGLAGPLLSTGMCNEVFQFDVSPPPASGAIITASSILDSSSKRRQNATRTNMGNNRRTLRGLPVPFFDSNFNTTEESTGRSSQNDSFKGNKSVSSMVVSVLVDPREAGEGEVDGMITPKSFSRIFVVVLRDSIKYVTYSCMLPRAAPHLVTT